MVSGLDSSLTYHRFVVGLGWRNHIRKITVWPPIEEFKFNEIPHCNGAANCIQCHRSTGRETGLSKRLNRKHPISQAKLGHRQGTDVPGRYRWFEAVPQAMSGYRIQGDGQGAEEQEVKTAMSTSMT